MASSPASGFGVSKMTELEKAVYEVLESSLTSMHVTEIFAAVKAKVPHLCDDTITPCPYCKQKHPLWQHQTRWALTNLKLKRGLAVSAGRGYWKLSGLGEPEEVARPPISRTLHDEIKEILYEIGQMEGRVSEKEYRINGERIDVAWKRIVTGAPYAVFEVQIGGNFYEALAKLKHAWDKWSSRPFLVTTDQYKERALEWIRGSFHEIEREMKIVDCDKVKELYEAVKKARDIKAELGMG